jgi:hypothetical protein
MRRMRADHYREGRNKHNVRSLSDEMGATTTGILYNPVSALLCSDMMSYAQSKGLCSIGDFMSASYEITHAKNMHKGLRK